MSHGYVPVQWNANKRGYDLVIALGVVAYLGAFMGVGLGLHGPAASLSPEILLIRALGSCAFLMLTLVLCVGPLARLSDRFRPMLYNRRHLGVATFLVGLAHFALALIWYHGFGVDNPLVSMLLSNPRYTSFAGFPFEALGFLALLILFVMAATSHDFWLANLGPSVWKALHMGAYLAYGLLVAHVALGVLQAESNPMYPALLAGSVLVVGALHLLAGVRERRLDGHAVVKRGVVISHPMRIPDKRARIIPVRGGDRIAVFRDGETLVAVANACAHQNGPLGEGRIVDGCVTCPWHGFQYVAATGRSPPPFTEKIATYRLLSQDGKVVLDTRPNPPGTPTTPLRIPEEAR